MIDEEIERNAKQKYRRRETDVHQQLLFFRVRKPESNDFISYPIKSVSDFSSREPSETRD